MHQSTTTGASFLMHVQTDSTMDLSDRRLPTFAKHDDPAGSDIFRVLLFGIACLGIALISIADVLERFSHFSERDK